MQRHAHHARGIVNGFRRLVVNGNKAKTSAFGTGKGPTSSERRRKEEEILGEDGGGWRYGAERESRQSSEVDDDDDDDDDDNKKKEEVQLAEVRHVPQRRKWRSKGGVNI